MVLKAIVLLFTIIGSAIFFAVLNDLLPARPPFPKVEKLYFGPGQKPTSESKEIRPFKINFGDKDVKDLKTRIELDVQRLKAAGIKPLEGSGFTNGFNLDYLVSDVTEYWLKKYDWKKQQAMLNSFPQFKTTIDGNQKIYLID